MDWQVIAPYIVPLVTFAAGYGALNARVARIEQSHVTRPEVEALSRRLDEVVTEIRGLRADLMAIIRER